MKYIVTESQKIKLMRRLSEIDILVKKSLDEIYTPNKICDLYDSGETLLDVVTEYVVEIMYYRYFTDTDDLSDEWRETYDMIVKYMKEAYSDGIKDYYNNNCD